MQAARPEFAVTSLGAGIARPWCVIAPWGVRVFFARVRPLSGLTFVFMPTLFPSRTRMALFAAGGILANTFVSVLGFVLWRWLPWGNSVWLSIAVVNGLMGSPNLIPFRIRVGTTVLRSDGALILQALRSGTFGATPPLIIQVLGAFRGLWLAIGDTRILRIQLLSAAEAWSFLGDIPQAESLYREADALPGNLPPSVRSLADLVRGGIAGFPPAGLRTPTRRSMPPSRATAPKGMNARSGSYWPIAPSRGSWAETPREEAPISTWCGLTH